MAFLSISAAARAAGKDRGTINRYLKSGRLSGAVDADGHTGIDTSELLRVFGELKSDGNTATSQEPPNTAQGNMEKTVVLQKLLQESQEREKWLKTQLESALEHNRELEKRLLALPEGKLKQHGFIARLFGR